MTNETAFKFCDYRKTGMQFNIAPYYRCTTCLDPNGSKYEGTALCFTCAAVCHKDHELVLMENRGGFYCDCGHGGVFPVKCQCMGLDLLTPENSRQTWKDIDLLVHFISDFKQQVISPANMRACTLTAVRAFNLEEPENLFAFKEHPYVAHAAVVCGFEGAPPVMPFPCASMALTGSVEPINSFVAKCTRGKIENLLTEGQLSGAQRAVVSALYFKGEWAVPFDPFYTKEKKFVGYEGEKLVPMMGYFSNMETTTGTKYRFVETENMHSLVLPYKDPRFAAVFTLPKSHVNQKGFWEPLSTEEYETHVNGDKSVYASACRIALPKFKIESRHPNVLEALSTCSFLPKGFAQSTGIDTIIHAAVIEIDEVGTEGAAATCMVARGCGPKLREWIGDVPFLFAIRDFETGSTIFSGLVDFTSGDSKSPPKEEACSSELPRKEIETCDPPRKDSSPKRQKTSSLTLPSPNAAPEEKTRSNSASSSSSSADGFNPFAGDWCGTKPQSGPLDTSVLAGDWSETETQKEGSAEVISLLRSSTFASRGFRVSTFIFNKKKYFVDVMGNSTSITTALSEGLPAIWAKCFRRSEPHRIYYTIDGEPVICLLGASCVPGRIYYIDPIDDSEY